MSPSSENQVPINPVLLHSDQDNRSSSQEPHSTSVTRSTIRSSSPQPCSLSRWGAEFFAALQRRIEQVEALQPQVKTIEEFLKEHDNALSKLARDVSRLIDPFVRQKELTKKHDELLKQHTELLKQHADLLQQHTELLEWHSDRHLDDDANDEADTQRRKRKKKSEANNKILTRVIVANLTMEQNKLRKGLRVELLRTLKDLSGIKDDSVIPPYSLPPGEQLYEGVNIYTPDFSKDVMSNSNRRIIGQAAYLVYRDRSKGGEVQFTELDVDKLAKESFKTWKAAYLKETDNSAKAKKKLDRLAMKEKYLVEYGVDPSPLLLMDWMSDYLSKLDDGDDMAKNVHRVKMQAAAGLKDLTGGDEVVWERVQPSFRSQEVNKVYDELDKFRAESRQEIGKKTASMKRVNLGSVNNRVPLVAPFPFMVDADWYDEVVRDKNLNLPFRTKKKDPRGFGANEISDDVYYEDMVSSDNQAA